MDNHTTEDCWKRQREQPGRQQQPQTQSRKRVRDADDENVLGSSNHKHSHANVREMPTMKMMSSAIIVVNPVTCAMNAN